MLNSAAPSLQIEAVLQALGGASEAVKAELSRKARATLEREKVSTLWVPNVGPQTEAYWCQADELFYGGQAGGGKSALMIGLSLTCHERSLLLRRTAKEAEGWVDDYVTILGDREGYNGQTNTWRRDGRIIDLSGCQLEADKQKFKGRPHDFIGFDEVADFSETQYTFIIGWNRSTTPGQRCRIVAAGNPPTTPEGLWVLRRWAAWLDPNHHNPAQPGELRWYTTGEDGKEIEVDGFGPHDIGGEQIMARSRTFIPAKLADNPDLAASGYAATLAALPEELRAAYRDGRFDVSLRDGAFQCIPTSWVRAAQERWTPHPPNGTPMCSIGVDVAQGGQDETVLAIRHDGWFAPLISVPGKLTPDGATVAGLVVSKRRDDATIVIDMGGGYGGAALEWLKEQDMPVVGYKGAEAGTGRTSDRQLAFSNRRSRAYWRLREALDPGQVNGSPIALPPDPGLVADLTAPTFRVGPHGIQVEAKESVVKRLGRSPDRGDAVVMAWEQGLKNQNIVGGFARGSHRAAPQVVMGRANARRTTPQSSNSSGGEHG